MSTASPEVFVRPAGPVVTVTATALGSVAATAVGRVLAETALAGTLVGRRTVS